MENKNNDKIFSKIEKLFALGQSPNENEAKLAMAQAHKLLTKYNLSAEYFNSVKDKDGKVQANENVFKTGKRLAQWKSSLLNGVAGANYCKFFIRRNFAGYELVIVGRKHNVAIAKYMFEYLCETVERLAKKNAGKGASAKNSYRIGMSSGLVQKLYEEMRRAEKEGVVVDGETSSALVVQNLGKDLARENSKFIRNKVGRLSNVRQRSSAKDYSNLSQGRSDAKNVSLNRQVGN